MCGIFAILGIQGNPCELRRLAVELSTSLQHRGPDGCGVCVQDIKKGNETVHNVLCHQLLAIVDPGKVTQPIKDESGDVALVVNGEIWNHKQLRKEVQDKHRLRTNGDCEPLVHLYEEYGDDMVKKVDGLFAFVISDQKNGNYLIARDPIGVNLLYIGWRNNDDSIWLASEMKALCNYCDMFEEFPPGHFLSSKTGNYQRWYNPPWFDEHIPHNPVNYPELRAALEKSVEKRLMTDVPFGVLLSGGLDSSLVASIVCRKHKDHAIKKWWPKVHSFSIGLPGSPDLRFAKEVANFLGTEHHEFHFTVEEGIDALPQVIKHIETYDVTTIRASTPMFLLSRKIKALGIKVVLSGEGSDEVFGGYLYFHKAPSPEKFHVETCHKVKMLSKYDCLRANKTTSAWGVEVREPFLDRDFLDVAMSIDPRDKMANMGAGKMEKFILRKSFDDPENPFLPNSVLWRQKEQFSDGVGYSWIDSLREHASTQVSDEDMTQAYLRFPYNTPVTNEAYLYRSIFHHFYPQESAAKTVPGGPSIACSTPAALEWEAAWKNTVADPSGRSVIGVHQQYVAML